METFNSIGLTMVLAALIAGTGTTRPVRTFEGSERTASRSAYEAVSMEYPSHAAVVPARPEPESASMNGGPVDNRYIQAIQGTYTNR